MAVDFEAPTAALFARLSSIPGIVYATRVLESWADSPPPKQPSLMLTSGGIDVIESKDVTGTPPLWTLKLSALLYVQTPDPTVAPSTIMNPLIAGVCNALLRLPNEPNAATGAQFVANPVGVRYTTLGGLCASCRVSGSIVRDEGLIGHTAAALIPIAMVLSS